ncbi:MAG: hypothetical protein K2Q26_04415 [Bdellovibrionales bacterium]|nr:hypothetical protein [Bdellovibrionales bacterium]
MATPNSFSNLLGKDQRHLEKLISRGACISWSPKNLASALIMFSIRWMVKHSSFRFFTAYSDVEARELGTIYQACNFTYLGQTSGARFEYQDPLNLKRGWFSDRQFRKSSQIKRYAKELGILWGPKWSLRDKILWEKIPREIISAVKEQAKAHQSRCLRRSLLPKHKYVYFLGSIKRETIYLRKLFERLNPQLLNQPYPKIRGPQINTADNILETKEITLTQNSQNCRPRWPLDKSYLTVKEVAETLRVSSWTIYSLIKTDVTFP